jgi:hypothetical protein
VDTFFKTLRIFTRQVRKQLAQYIKRVNEQEKNPRQAGEWVCIFIRQAEILLAFGELASGYSHSCCTVLVGSVKKSLHNQ